jgi:hypothetical protein
MLDWAKAIHEAIGIESPRTFVAVFALIGLLLFGFVGWVIDHGYRVRLRQQSVQAGSPQDKPPPSGGAAPKSEPSQPESVKSTNESVAKRNQTKPAASQGPSFTNAPGGTIIQQDNRGSSGNNSQTVTVNSMSWILSDVQVAKFRQALAAFPPNIVVIWETNGDPYAHSFAESLGKALGSMDGWKVEWGKCRSSIKLPWNSDRRRTPRFPGSCRDSAIVQNA